MVSATPLELMGIPCHHVTSWNLTDKCDFVHMIPSCQPSMGFVNYLQLMYCLLGPDNVTYTVGMSVVWLLLLFVALGVTSGEFLTPALFVISKTLHMTQNVAGVTLLAFGNGSPDIFSSLAGIKQGSYEMVIGSLIGGGIFVTTIVAGSILLTQPFKMAGRPFLRDCFCYLTAATWAFYLFYTGSISFAHALGFICLYLAYIVVVVLSGFFYQRHLSNEKRKANTGPTECKAEKIEKGTWLERCAPDDSCRPYETQRPATTLLAAGGCLPRGQLLKDGVGVSASSYSLRRYFSCLCSSPSERPRVVSSGCFVHFLKSSADSLNDGSLVPSRSEAKMSENFPREKVVCVKRVFKKPRPFFDDPESHYVVPLAFRYLQAEGQEPAAEANNNEPDPEEGVYYINLGMDSREEEVDVDTLAITVDSPRRGSNLEKLHPHKVEEKRKVSLCCEFFGRLFPVSPDEWSEQSVSLRLMAAFKAPIFAVLAITTPIVDGMKPKKNWCRPLNTLHCITAPVFVCFAFGYGQFSVAGVLPVWAIVAGVGAVLALVVVLTSSNDVAPKYHSAFAYAGFLVGVVWIYVISMEIVVLLQAVGIVFKISDAILGLTILAWGNGLLDFLANLNIARKGFPRMGIAACFGTPCLTLLLGVGIPSLIQLGSSGGILVLKYSKLITVLFAALATSLLSSVAIMVAVRFNTKRLHGGYLLALYFTFLSIAVLVETGFI